jgi:hypothetical protein
MTPKVVILHDVGNNIETQRLEIPNCPFTLLFHLVDNMVKGNFGNR